MATFDEVAEFVRRQTAHRGPVTKGTSLQSDIGLYGDDMHEFLTAYAQRFEVELSEYLWYFHTDEEGFSIGRLFFPPPNARVRQIPITVGMLHDFTQLHRWAVEYPEHERPRSRPDIRINQLLVLASIGILVIVGVRGCP